MSDLPPQIHNDLWSDYYKALNETLYCHTLEEVKEKCKKYNPDWIDDNYSPNKCAADLYAIINGRKEYDRESNWNHLIICDKIRYKYVIDLVPDCKEDDVYVYEYGIIRDCDIHNNIKVIGQYNKILYNNQEISNNFMHFPLLIQYQLVNLKIYSKDPTLQLEFDSVIYSQSIRKLFITNTIYNRTTDQIIQAGRTEPIKDWNFVAKDFVAKDIRSGNV